jgi:dienelactone hydrolase
VTPLSAGPPLEVPVHPVGWSSVTLVDEARNGRRLAADIWYPAVGAEAPMVVYELLPGISFESAGARRRPPLAPGRFPLLLLSHGRTGMRFNYSLLCEALAGRGAVVISADHPGDGLFDWLGGTFVDDRTNEINRVADTRFILDSLLVPGSQRHWPDEIVASIDGERVAAIGHSYGAYTGLASAAGVRGVPPETRLRAVIGLQPYTRSMSDSALARVNTATLLVLSEFDVTAPPRTDGERPWSLIPARPTWRFDLGAAAHHASSDMGLYLELAKQLGDLPPMVAAYVAMMTSETTGPNIRQWRESLVIQVRVISAFLDIVLAIDRVRGENQAEQLLTTPGVALRRR